MRARLLSWWGIQWWRRLLGADRRGRGRRLQFHPHDRQLLAHLANRQREQNLQGWRLLMRKLIGILAASFISSAALAADTSVPNMTAGAAMSDTDLLYCAQSSGATDRKCTGAQVKTYANTSAVNPQTGT